MKSSSSNGSFLSSIGGEIGACIFLRLFTCLPRQPTVPRRILFDRGQDRCRPKYVRRIVGSTGGHTSGARSSFLRSLLAWRLPLCGASTVPKISSVPRAFLVFPASLTPNPSPLPMKSHTEYLTFNLPARMAFENITPQVEAIVKKSGVEEGLVLVNAMHITASVFINDDEPGLHEDYKKWLEGLAPFDAVAHAVRPQPHGRRQRRRPHEAAGHGPRSGRGDHERQARFRPVGADLLRRIRRPTAEAGVGEGDRGVNGPNG